MEMVQEFFRTVYNVPDLIRLVGLAGMIAIVFAETGLLIGFFLPGDSLLVTAGLFAARGDFNVVWLNIALSLAAIVGDAVGYTFGYRTGKALFNRPNSFFFRREHLLKTHAFYERHGGKTIVLARFMPIIRTFAPIVAGIGQMTYRRFAAFNVIGGIGWVLSMTLLGYFLGHSLPPEMIDRHIHLIVAIVIFLSLLPGLIAWVRTRFLNPTARTPAPE